MFTTVVAILCHALSANVPACVEEVVTDTAMSGVTMQACQMGGQIGISKWMAGHPVYRSWVLQGWKCVAGHYSPKGAA